MIRTVKTTKRRQFGNAAHFGGEKMARKNKRLKTEYHRGLGFDPRKYITVPVHHAVRSTPEHTPQRGEIWFADLGSHPNSSVQGGIRPVVIVSNDIGNAHADTVNIVPMTRHLKKPELPCHTKLSPECITDARQLLDTSMILAEQITTIGKKCLCNYVGKIADKAVLHRIDKAVAAQLGIERSNAECL